MSKNHLSLKFNTDGLLVNGRYNDTITGYIKIKKSIPSFIFMTIIGPPHEKRGAGLAVIFR